MRKYRVFYDYSAFGRGRGRFGREIAVDRRFYWGGKWLVPSVYLCRRGLVVELFKKIEQDKLQRFMEKYDLDENSDEEGFGEEMRMNIERENPLNEDIKVYANINGEELRWAFSSCDCFSPLDADCDGDIKRAIDYYGLDKDCYWLRTRASLPLKQKCRRVCALSLTLKARRKSVPGIHFAAEKSGDKVNFTCPADGKQYTLTVESMEKEQLNLFGEGGSCAHFTVMTYTVSPELPKSAMTVVDLSPSESTHGAVPQYDGAAAIGIIGGADGPTVITARSDSDNLRTACSSVTASDGHKADWFIKFFTEPKKDIVLKIR